MKGLKANWQFIVKLLVSLGFLTALFSKWADFSNVWDGVLFLISAKPAVFIFSCSLIFLNWGIESFKWKVLLQKIFFAKIKDTIQYVLTGVAIGFITPGRSGEFAGRMILMPNKIRLESILLSMIGGITQTIPGIALGIFFSTTASFHVISKTIDTTLLIAALLILTVVYFFINEALAYPPVKSLLKSITIHPDSTPTFQNSLLILLLSFLRFAVYVIQYILILDITGITASESIAPICWMLLLQSMSPAVAVLDLGIRGSIAFWVFTQFGMFSELVISTVFLIWFINLCVPALLGYLLILNWKRK